MADGYKTESGLPLSEADSNEFIIKPDGNIDFGEITLEIEKATNGEITAGKIRVKVGFDKNGTGNGLIHMKKRERDIVKLGYPSAEQFISEISKNYDSIYTNHREKDRISLIMHDSTNALAPIDLELSKDGDVYYAVISAIPMRDGSLKTAIKNERLLYSKLPSLTSDSDNGAVQNYSNTNKVGGVEQGENSAKSNLSSAGNISQAAEDVNDVSLNPNFNNVKDKILEHVSGYFEHSKNKVVAEGKAVERVLKELKNAVGKKLITKADRINNAAEKRISELKKHALDSMPTKDAIDYCTIVKQVDTNSANLLSSRSRRYLAVIGSLSFVGRQVA